MPADQIAFIHEANTEVRKKELFSKVRTGQVRVLLGSTAKMGAGTNVQDQLVALHDLDCPWRPGDLAQRKGRIERQGNSNPLVHVYRYIPATGTVMGGDKRNTDPAITTFINGGLFRLRREKRHI